MKKKLSILTTVVLCAAMFAGCDKGKTENTRTPSGKPITLTVFAAASLTEALLEIAALYKASAPAVTLVYNFDSSGKLQTQIENGAKADLFLSAGKRQMDALVSGGFIDTATRRDLLNNKIVLIVPDNSTKGIASFEDVLTDKVKLIALGNADVPVGQYSQEIFEFLKGWDIVSRKASFGSNVKEVLSQVETASLDCGVVYSTDAPRTLGVRVAAFAPQRSHRPVTYPAAALKETADDDAARSFLDFLSTPEAAAVFEKIGFEVVINPKEKSCIIIEAMV